MKFRPLLLLCAASLMCGLTPVHAEGFADAIHDVETRLDDAALDAQSGALTPEG